MEDLIIVGGLILGVYLLKKHLDASKLATPGDNVPIPTALGASTAPTTSAAYQTSGVRWVMGIAPTSASGSGTVPAPPPVPPPPPPFYGGGVGGVGSGGNPLGGSLRAGVSAGTGTTVVSYRAPTAAGAGPAAPPMAIDPATLAQRRASLTVSHR